MKRNENNNKLYINFKNLPSFIFDIGKIIHENTIELLCDDGFSNINLLVNLYNLTFKLFEIDIAIMLAVILIKDFDFNS